MKHFMCILLLVVAPGSAMENSHHRTRVKGLRRTEVPVVRLLPSFLLRRRMNDIDFALDSLADGAWLAAKVPALSRVISKQTEIGIGVRVDAEAGQALHHEENVGGRQP